MGQIIQFDIGCRNCKHLLRIGKDTYMCNELNDGETEADLYPIIDGKKTDDWGVCGGESREVDANYTRQHRRSS